MIQENVVILMSLLDIEEAEQNGDWLNCQCPLAPYSGAHKKGTDSNPSSGISINDEGPSYFNCFTCNENCDIPSLIAQLEHYRGENYQSLKIDAAMLETATKLPSWENIRKKNIKKSEPAMKPVSEDSLKAYSPIIESKEAREYLAGRGVKKSTVDKLGIVYQQSEKRIVFPVRGSDGTLYGCTGRTILTPDQYPVYKSGKAFPKVRGFSGLKKNKLILGAERWRERLPVLIVEGLFGYARLVQIGVEEHFNIGATMGAKLTIDHLNILIKFGQPVYLLYDNDEAGDTGLFGKADKQGVRNNTGAIAKIKPHLPLFLPQWPKWETLPEGIEDLAGGEKYDTDHLTLAEVVEMKQNTTLYADAY